MFNNDVNKYKEDNERLRKRIAELENTINKGVPEDKEHHYNLLTNLSKYSQFIISIYNVEKREFLFLTKTLFDFLNYSSEYELQNKPFNYEHKFKYIHPDDADIVRKADERVSGLTDKCTIDIEYRAKHADGYWVWLRRVTSVFSRNANGKIEQLMVVFEDVTEQRKIKERLAKLNECFLSKTNDFDENINNIVKLCGSMMKADTAIYNKLVRNNIISVGMWHTPKDYTPVDSYKGHICTDVVKGKFNDDVVIIQDLQNSKYYDTDKNVSKYNLQTYIGVPVKYKDKTVGSLCVVFVKKYVPTRSDIEFMTLLSSALSIEEERKYSEQEVLDSESSYRKLFNLSPTGILIEKINGDIIDVNSEMVKISGYTRAELIGMNVKNLVPTENHPEVDKNILKIIAENNIYHEVVNIRKDGTLRNIELRETKIKLPDGNDGILVICNDITLRKRAEMSLRESEESLRILINSTPDIILFKDGNGRWLEANDSILEVFGLNKSNYKGKSDKELSLTNEYNKNAFLFCSETDEKTWKNKKPTRSEETIPQKDGTVKVFDVIKVPLFKPDGSRKGLIIFGRNITDYSKATKELIDAKENAESATNIKSDFLSTMSHEIRTPLNGVIGMTSLLMQTDLNNEQSEAVELIKQSGESLLKLINEVLDFSKIESGKAILEEKSFILENCIKEVIGLFANIEMNKKVEYSYSIDKDVPVAFIGDMQRVKQIFINLISNSSKFTDKGFVKVEVKVNEKNKYFTSLSVSVSDSGIGIREEFLPKLFHPFSQISVTNNKSGTGLGLSITKKLVELMNGKIWVKSTPGEGSTFFFTLRLKISDNNGEQRESVKKDMEFGNLSDSYPLNILLVEDNPINQKVAQRILRKIGYEIDTAENGLVALKKVKEKKYDIIFMDIQMPEMDGLEATENILKEFKDKAPKIIAMTAAVMKGDKEKCLKAGMVDYIPKPVLPEVVYKVLSRWCKKDK